MNKKVIMLADDDRDDTDMFCEALADIDDGIICHCAINGEDLLKILFVLDQDPQLIFLDMNMPIMDGKQCLTILKSNERYKDIPVIMISTSSHKKDMEIAIELGAIAYFVKPHDYNEFKYILRAITENIGTGLKKTLVDLKASGNKQIYACD